MRKIIKTVLAVMAFAAVLPGMTACKEAKVTVISAPVGYVSAKGDAGELPDTGTLGGYEYSILKPETRGQGIKKNRGYYIDTLEELNSPYLLFISMGEKGSGGYEINVSDVLVNDQGAMTVVVEETSPSGEEVTGEMTAPYCGVKLKKCPDDIKVIDIYGNEFRNLTAE